MNCQPLTLRCVYCEHGFEPKYIASSEWHEGRLDTKKYHSADSHWAQENQTGEPDYFRFRRRSAGSRLQAQSLHGRSPLEKCMKPLLIQGGRIIDPGQGIDETGSLLITEGKISWLGEATPPQPDYDVLHAEGLIVCPGFIDLHCHLRQPGFEEKETIATGTRAAARGGFTTVCCMPNTNPPLDNEATIDYVKSIAAREGVVRVLPIGCVSRGRKGEELVDMAELASAGVIAFSDDGEPVSNPQLMRQALDYSRAFGLPVIDHCEDTALTEGGQMNEGVISLELGLRGIPAAAEEIMVPRDLALARLTGGHLHIAHVSTEGSVELIRRGQGAGHPGYRRGHPPPPHPDRGSGHWATTPTPR